MVPFPPDPNGKLKSGVIKILDSTSFFISKLNLWIEDEPGYRFWVGNSTTMKPDRGGFMVCMFAHKIHRLVWPDQTLHFVGKKLNISENVFS